MNAVQKEIRKTQCAIFMNQQDSVSPVLVHNPGPASQPAQRPSCRSSLGPRKLLVHTSEKVADRPHDVLLDTFQIIDGS